jgi:hypothetical protein
MTRRNYDDAIDRPTHELIHCLDVATEYRVRRDVVEMNVGDLLDIRAKLAGEGKPPRLSDVLLPAAWKRPAPRNPQAPMPSEEEARERLSKLVSDPHPGILTWCEAYIRAVDALVATAKAETYATVATECEDAARQNGQIVRAERGTQSDQQFASYVMHEALNKMAERYRTMSK